MGGSSGGSAGEPGAEEQLGEWRRLLVELRRSLEAAIERPPGEALAAAKAWRLIRLRAPPMELWAAIGREADYIIIPRLYCSCPHFTITVLGRGVAMPCYHLVAVELARRGAGRYTDLAGRLKPSEVGDIVVEVLAGWRSPTLRKILARESSGGGASTSPS